MESSEQQQQLPFRLDLKNKDGKGGDRGKENTEALLLLHQTLNLIGGHPLNGRTRICKRIDEGSLESLLQNFLQSAQKGNIESKNSSPNLPPFDRTIP